MRILVIVSPSKDYGIDAAKLGEATGEYVNENQLPPRSDDNPTLQGWVIIPAGKTVDYTWADYVITIGPMTIGDIGVKVDKNITETHDATQDLIDTYDTWSSLAEGSAEDSE